MVQNKARIVDHGQAPYKWEVEAVKLGSDLGKEMGPPPPQPMERNAALLDTSTVPRETPAGLLTSRAVGNDPACSSHCVVVSYTHRH